MTHYRYNRQVDPPAPFVYVGLRSPHDDDPPLELPALVDTGADTTVVPLQVVESLGLPPLDEMPTVGFGGQLTFIPTFLIRLRLRGLVEMSVEVLASPDESYVLLGRDVLNRFKLTLDGPGLSLEIG